MKVRTYAAVLALAILFAGCKPGPQEARESRRAREAVQRAGSASGFDFYLLNLSWSPEFCYSHPAAAECAAHPGFVLHGLWPENFDGSYPEHCSDAPGPADPTTYKDIYPDAGLLEHEWKQHGTCSGLGADAFFGDARQAFQSVAIPPRLSALHAATSLGPNEIVGLFSTSNPGTPEGSFRVSCGHNYLTAVEVCLDKSLHPVACPVAIRTCRANVVRITPP